METARRVLTIPGRSRAKTWFEMAWFSSAVAFAPSPGDSVYANLRLRKGTYRLRLRLRAASTRGRYGPYKTLKVR